MGNVVDLGNYLKAKPVRDVDLSKEPKGLVPLEFAVARGDVGSCMQKLFQYGEPQVHVRQIKGDVSTQLHFISASDAIWINKKILESEDLGDGEISWRIDLIQTLENTNLTFMDSMWAALGTGSGSLGKQTPESL